MIPDRREERLASGYAAMGYNTTEEVEGLWSLSGFQEELATRFSGEAGGFEGWAQSEAGFNINEGMVFTSGLQDTRRTASEALHNSSGLLRKEVERNMSTFLFDHPNEASQMPMRFRNEVEKWFERRDYTMVGRQNVSMEALLGQKGNRNLLPGTYQGIQYESGAVLEMELARALQASGKYDGTTGQIFDDLTDEGKGRWVLEQAGEYGQFKLFVLPRDGGPSGVVRDAEGNDIKIDLRDVGNTEYFRLHKIWSHWGRPSGGALANLLDPHHQGRMSVDASSPDHQWATGMMIEAAAAAFSGRDTEFSFPERGVGQRGEQPWFGAQRTLLERDVMGRVQEGGVGELIKKAVKGAWWLATVGGRQGRNSKDFFKNALEEARQIGRAGKSAKDWGTGGVKKILEKVAAAGGAGASAKKIAGATITGIGKILLAATNRSIGGYPGRSAVLGTVAWWLYDASGDKEGLHPVEMTREMMYAVMESPEAQVLFKTPMDLLEPLLNNEESYPGSQASDWKGSQDPPVSSYQPGESGFSDVDVKMITAIVDEVGRIQADESWGAWWTDVLLTDNEQTLAASMTVVNAMFPSLEREMDFDPAVMEAVSMLISRTPEGSDNAKLVWGMLKEHWDKSGEEQEGWLWDSTPTGDDRMKLYRQYLNEDERWGDLSLADKMEAMLVGQGWGY